MPPDTVTRQILLLPPLPILGIPIIFRLLVYIVITKHSELVSIIQAVYCHSQYPVPSELPAFHRPTPDVPNAKQLSQQECSSHRTTHQQYHHHHLLPEPLRR